MKQAKSEAEAEIIDLPHDYERFMAALLEGNRKLCAAILKEFLGRGLSPFDAYVALFQRALYEIGDLWEQGKVSVAHEHVATAIIDSLLSNLHPSIFQSDRTGGKAIIACVTGELHEIGAKMVADVFEMEGWDTTFVGADTPRGDLISLVEMVRPDLVGVSVSIRQHVQEFEQLTALLGKNFPKLPIIVGGQALKYTGIDTSGQNRPWKYIPSITELRAWLRSPEAKCLKAKHGF